VLLAFAMRARRWQMDGGLHRRSVTLTRGALVAGGTDGRSRKWTERERIPNAKGSGAAGPRATACGPLQKAVESSS
jgi:hypothetical protein